MKIVSSNCELCNDEAVVYCHSDVASLCWSCDTKVHQANFLVARHIRNTICSNCNNRLTQHLLSGISPSSFITNICSYCSHSIHSSSSSSSSSSTNCISTILSSASATPTPTPSRKLHSHCHKFDTTTNSFNKVTSGTSTTSTRSRVPSHDDVDIKAEAIFANWCRGLGIPADQEAIRKAREALRVCWEYMPLQVSLAASLYFGLRFRGDKSLSMWQLLKKLEDISGVSANVISAAVSKLECLFKVSSKKQRIQSQELEEGWAECSTS